MTTHPSPDQTTLAAGAEIMLSCSSSGNPKPSITWILNGEELQINDPLNLFSASFSSPDPYSIHSELTIGPATVNVTGTYQCLARGFNFSGEPEVAASNTSQLTFQCEYSHM